MDVYRRYCRLFIEDSRKRETYSAKIKYFKDAGYDVSRWINDLKTFDEQFFLSKNVLTTKTAKLQESTSTDNRWWCNYNPLTEGTLAKKCGAHFDSSQSNAQVFAIPKTLMVYLTQNSGIKVYRKLIQTCKYFFHVKQIVPVWYLGVVDYHGQPSLFHENSIYLQNKKQIPLNHKIWLEHTADFCGDLKLIDKIYQCDIQYLHISSVNMTFAEYEILVKHGSVKEINIFYTTITTPENEENVTLEKVMEMLPNASKMLVIF